MDKFNELDLQGCVALEDVLTTAAFIQITQLEDFATTRGAKPAGDETFKPLPVNVEVDKLSGDLQALALKTSNDPQGTSPTAFKDFITPEFQQDIILLFENDTFTCLEESGTFSSDSSNDVFHTPPECLIAFHIIPETPVDGINNVTTPDQDEHVGDILVDLSLVQNKIVLGSKDSENLPQDVGLVVSVCTSPCQEINSACRDLDDSFSSLERQSSSGAISLTPVALVDSSNSSELSPSFLALLPSPISSEMSLEGDPVIEQYLHNMTQMVDSTLVDNLNKMYITQAIVEEPPMIGHSILHEILQEVPMFL